MGYKLFGFMVVQWGDVLDIIIISIVFYYIFLLLKGTRAVQMFAGFIILAVIYMLSLWWKLKGVEWIFSNMATVGLVSMVILFQPELRGALTRIGLTATHVSWQRLWLHPDQTQGQIREVLKAVFEMSEQSYGAIIVLERKIGLKNYIDTGVEIGGKITASLLRTLFFPNTPLHDGAVIIQEGKIAAAGCTLPLNPTLVDIPENLGMRHRAAKAIAMESDAIVVVVSEETGKVSLIYGNTMLRGIKPKELEEKLINLIALGKEA